MNYHTSVTQGVSLYVGQPKPPNYRSHGDYDINLALLNLNDALYRAVAGHRFYREAIESIIAEHTDLDPSIQHGLSLTAKWLQDQDRMLMESLERIREQALTP